jgi:hypothetical protein
MAISRSGPVKPGPPAASPGGMAGHSIPIMGLSPTLLKAGWELFRDVGNPRIIKIRGSHRRGVGAMNEGRTHLIGGVQNGIDRMHGLPGHDLEGSGQGVQLLCNKGIIGVRQQHELRADRNLTGGSRSLGWRREVDHWNPMRTRIRKKKPINSTRERLLGHLLWLFKPGLDGGGDKGDSGEDSSHLKLPRSLWQSELLV